MAENFSCTQDAVKEAIIYCIQERGLDCNESTIVEIIALYLNYTKSCQEDGATTLVNAALKQLRTPVNQHTICRWIAAFKARTADNPALINVKSNTETLCLDYYQANSFATEDKELATHIETKLALNIALAKGGN